MNIQPAAFNPVSRIPSTKPGVLDARPDATKFVRLPKDRAIGSGIPAQRIPDIDPNAPEDEKAFFRTMNTASDRASLGPLTSCLFLTLRRFGNERSWREEFTFKQKPASLQTSGSSIVINFGSKDDHSEGQLSLVGNRLECQGEILQQPKMKEFVIKHAALALASGIAREKNMPYAASALQESLKWNQQFDELGRHVGS